MVAPRGVHATDFTRLQVLLPGETAAPGTPSGKVGEPSVQTVGVPFTVQIRACDDGWNTALGVTDLVQWSCTDSTADPPAVAPLTNGQLAVTATFNSAGNFTISGRDLSDPTIDVAISASVETVLLAGFAFARIDREFHVAGQPIDVEIRAVGPFGHLAESYSGAVNLEQLTSFGPGRVSPAVVTLSDGIWSGQIVPYRADETNSNRGNVKLYASLPGDISINGFSNPFVVHPGDLSRIQIVLPGQEPLPGSVSGLTGSPATQGATQPFGVDVYATDAYWNPVPGDDYVRITTTDLAANLSLVLALVGGEASALVELVTIGDQTLTAIDVSDNNVSSMTSAPIAVIPAFADHFEFNNLPAVVVAGTENLVTIRAVDADGQLVPEFNGDTQLTATTGPGSISPETATFTDGIWQGILKFYGAEAAVQVTCSDYADPPHQGFSTTTNVLPGPYVATQIILPSQMAQAGTGDGFVGQPEDQQAGRQFVIQVRAVDQYFNRVTGIHDPVLITATDPNLSVPDDVALDNGVVLVPVTAYLAGTLTINALDTAVEDIGAPASSAFTVAPGSYAKLLVIAPGETSHPSAFNGRAGTATDQTIASLFTVDAFAADQWFNPVAGIDDVVHLTCTDPDAELPADTALVDGMAALDVRLNTGGFQLLTLTSTRNPSIAAGSTQMRVVSSGLHFEVAIVESSVQAGQPFTLHVIAVNDAGSIIQETNTGVRVTVRNANTLEPGSGILTPSSFQLLQGQRTLPLIYTRAEPIILEVADNAGNASGLTGVLEVLPGTASNITLRSEPEWVPAGSTAVVIAGVTDAYDNPVADQPVTCAAAAGDQGWMSAHADAKRVDDPAAGAKDTPLISLTDTDGVARTDYHSPRQAQVTQLSASSGQLNTDYEMETALVDPTAGGGHITNYPNPFHPDETATTIAYTLDDAASVRLRIYTVSGGLVLDRRIDAGDVGGSSGLNEIQWDGRNGDGQPVASGGYVVYVEAEGSGATQHVMRRKIGVVW